MAKRAAPPPQAVSDRVRRVDARRNLEAIIDAAVPLLCEAPRASMQQIAAAAVHRHFPSRDDLLEELRQRAFTASSEALNRVRSAPSDDPGETLRLATVVLLQVGDAFRLYRYTTWRSADADGPALQIGRGLSELVTAAQQAGRVRSDLPAVQLVAALGGLIWAVLPQVADETLTLDGAAAMIGTLLAA
jgi:AcrR family transcriptional regulator